MKKVTYFLLAMTVSGLITAATPSLPAEPCEVEENSPDYVVDMRDEEDIEEQK